jgi:hypothetical protein
VLERFIRDIRQAARQLGRETHQLRAELIVQLKAAVFEGNIPAEQAVIAGKRTLASETAQRHLLPVVMVKILEERNREIAVDRFWDHPNIGGVLSGPQLGGGARSFRGSTCQG